MQDRGESSQLGLKNGIKVLVIVLLVGFALFDWLKKRSEASYDIDLEALERPSPPPSPDAKALVAQNHVISAKDSQEPTKTSEKVLAAEPAVPPQNPHPPGSKANPQTKPKLPPIELDYRASFSIQEKFYKDVLRVDEVAVTKIYDATTELVHALVDVYEDHGDNPYEDKILVDVRVTNAILDRYKLEIETHLTKNQVSRLIKFFEKNDKASSFRYGDLYFDSSVLIRALSDQHGKAEILKGV